MADPAAHAELPKTYDPGANEPRVTTRWDEAGAFHAVPANVGSTNQDPDVREPYCILIPPPNVTAALHLGHALNNTLQDVLVRAHRMMGAETLWMPGTDHAGIATQTVVDKKLKEAGKPALADYKRKELEGENGRDQFVELVKAWSDEFEQTITDQLKAMGCSCDWPRQRFTMDDVCARAVREAFFRLFKDGLIYRGKRLVNWDPATQTALSDDEVENKEIDGAFYYLRYPLVHASRNPSDPLDVEEVTWSELATRGYPGAQDHPDDENAWITVATTRPETYLGDTAVAVNPKDPRAKALEGLMVQLPLVGRVIPILTDDYVVLPVSLGGDPNDPKAQMATGFLKVTPAHDPNDWDIGHRHKDRIERECSAHAVVINVMAPDASISDQHGWSDVGDARAFLGLTREEARKKIVQRFKDEGLLEDTKPHRHAVGHSYRSHVPIEPYLSDQWYCKVTDDRLRGFAQRALREDQRSTDDFKPRDVAGDGELTFYPARYAKTYETWHDNLRDWCISRQLWWGHRIPVWRKRVHLTESNWYDELVATGLDHVIEKADAPIAAWTSATDGMAISIVRTADGVVHDLAADPLMPVGPETEGEYDIFVCSLSDGVSKLKGFERDPDVLDTWFSSALWPLSTLGWPDADAAARDTGLADFPTLLDTFNPTSVLCTAREIITLWVSRMVMFNRYFLSPDDGKTPGRLPFHDVFIHAMIQDGEGRKMSKSLGNGVDPRDIIASHGSDAMRFTLAKMTTQTQDVRMPVEHDAKTGKNTSPKFDEGRNVCNKLWNAARLTLAQCGSIPEHADLDWNSEPTLADRWILSRIASTVADLEWTIKNYQFSDYATSMYDLLWRDFCDWYLEAAKLTVADDTRQQVILRTALDCIIRLLHPICPFITETIHERLRAIPPHRVPGVHLASHDLLCRSSWPAVDERWNDEEALTRFERVRALVSAIREVRAQHQVPAKRRVTAHISADLEGALLNDAPLVEHLAGLARLTADAPEGPSSAFVFEGVACAVSDLADDVDESAEAERLAKRRADLEKSIKALEGRLSNPGYTQKAPAHLVDETRAELARAKDELATLGGM